MKKEKKGKQRSNKYTSTEVPPLPPSPPSSWCCLKCVSSEGCVRAQGRRPEPTMTNWGNASKTCASIPQDTAEHNRRELVAFCQGCWHFTDFRHNKGTIAALELMTKLKIDTHRTASVIHPENPYFAFPLGLEVKPQVLSLPRREAPCCSEEVRKSTTDACTVVGRELSRLELWSLTAMLAPFSMVPTTSQQCSYPGRDGPLRSLRVKGICRCLPSTRILLYGPYSASFF